jgi:DNA-binding response OmpR family regulator
VGSLSAGIDATEDSMAELEKKSRILIVEDHPLIAELVETRLRIEGMQPVKAPGGREAIALIESQPFDCVILDIMMPDVDGYEVLRHIRSSAATASLPVIFLTAKATPADIEKGLALGASHYITKPFSGVDLVRKVRTCLEEHRGSRAGSSAAG